MEQLLISKGLTGWSYQPSKRFHSFSAFFKWGGSVCIATFLATFPNSAYTSSVPEDLKVCALWTVSYLAEQIMVTEQRKKVLITFLHFFFWVFKNVEIDDVLEPLNVECESANKMLGRVAVSTYCIYCENLWLDSLGEGFRKEPIKKENPETSVLRAFILASWRTLCSQLII